VDPPRNSRASEPTSAGVRRRRAEEWNTLSADPEAHGGEPPGAGGGTQVSGGARVQPRGWASVPGRLGSLGASSRAGGFGECPEGADAAAEAPLHREGSASRVGTEAASGGVGVQAPPPARPGLVPSGGRLGCSRGRGRRKALG